MDCWAPLSMEFSRQEYSSVLAIPAILFSRGAYQPRDRSWVSCIADEFFTIWATRLPTGHSRLPQTSIFFSFYSPCQIASSYYPPDNLSLILISAGLLCEGSPSSPGGPPWFFKYFPLLWDHFLLYQLLYRTIFVYMSFSLEQTCWGQDYGVSLWSPRHTAWQIGGVH